MAGLLFYSGDNNARWKVNEILKQIILAIKEELLDRTKCRTNMRLIYPKVLMETEEWDAVELASNLQNIKLAKVTDVSLRTAVLFPTFRELDDHIEFCLSDYVNWDNLCKEVLINDL